MFFNAVLFIPLIFSLIIPPGTLRYADLPQLESPKAGDVLQGIVPIIGSSDVMNYVSSEVSFCYDKDPQTWFLIQQSSEPVHKGELAQWDTTLIADGPYRLRLQAKLRNGSVVEIRVDDLRVGNYTPFQQHTRAPTEIASGDTLLAPGMTPTVFKSAPTSLPKNPAEITSSDVKVIFMKGIFITAIVFALAGIYIAAGTLRNR